MKATPRIGNRYQHAAPSTPAPRPATTPRPAASPSPRPAPPTGPATLFERNSRILRRHLAPPPAPGPARLERGAGARVERMVDVRNTMPEWAGIMGDRVRVRQPFTDADLGSFSEKEESGGRGSGVINAYQGKAKGDKGGASYGVYQFASMMKKGTDKPAKSTPLQAFLARSKYGAEFKGLTPATPEFDAKWKKLAIDHPAEFAADQHAVISQLNYQPALKKLPRGLQLRGQAFHEVIWSRSVQLGPGGAARLIKKSLKDLDPKAPDAVAIEKIYRAQVEKIPKQFRGSPGLHKQLEKRFERESHALVHFAKEPAPPLVIDTPSPVPPPTMLPIQRLP